MYVPLVVSSQIALARRLSSFGYAATAGNLQSELAESLPSISRKVSQPEDLRQNRCRRHHDTRQQWQLSR